MVTDTKSAMKLVVLISGSGSNLQAFIDQIASGELNAEIALVVSNKADAYGLDRAAKANIPTAVVEHANYASREDFDQALLEEIKPYNPDLLILAGFMRILTPGFIQQFTDQILNIHPSLLPKYKGLNTHQRAIDAKDQFHGASVHVVTAELDDGPVVIQGQLPLSEADTPETLQQRIHKIEHQIYPLAINWIINGVATIHSGKVTMKSGQEQLLSFPV
jgi:phosphoribosylglycinamide formyltransferase-1